MPKPLQATLATAYGSVAEDLKKRIGDAMAAQAGPPMSSDIEPATDEKRVNAWNARDPKATDQAMQALAAEKYQAHRQAGMDEETAIRATAEDLTHFRYAQRLKQYTYGQVSFSDQVAEAKRLAKLAARTSTPDPPPAPPTMPSASLTNAATLGALPELPPALPPVAEPLINGANAPMLPGGSPLTGVGQQPSTPPPPPPLPGGY